MIETISYIVAILYLGYIIYEKIINDKRLKSFKHIIHINGTRGKSTTCRLIDAGLRNCGWKVFTKTTGTIPTIIDVNGNVERIKRLGNANIREQLRIVKQAYKQKAEILVIECMAIQPELQSITQHKMLKADIVAITNVRHDHLSEMGSTLNDIAFSLANTVPFNGHLIVSSDEHKKVFERRAITNNSQYYLAKAYAMENDFDTFPENVNIALTVAEILAVSQDAFTEGMRNYIKDPGALKYYQIDKTIFINGLSINDPDSIKIVYRKITEQFSSSDLTILLNNRLDRPKRALQLVDLFNDIECKNILLCGGNAEFIKHRIKKTGNFNVRIIKNFKELNQEKVIFAIGNIAHTGYKLLDYCEKNGRIIYG